jgi:demethylspheroidene O-methyltransferase
MRNALAALRDRWLSRPEVRARIGRWPIGRRVADAHARRLFGLVAGFAHSQMLAGAIEIGLFARLADGAMAAAALHDATGIDARAFDAVVDAMIALHLIERRGDRLALTVDGWVIATDPGLRAMIAHNQLLYRDLAAPEQMFRTPGSGALAQFWPYRGGGDAAGYSRLMAESLDSVAGAVFDSVDFARFDHVMDVGGGEGAFITRLATHSQARLTLADLPPVIARARAAIERAGLAGRVTCQPVAAGVPLPGPVDAITLIRVLHDQDDDAAVALLRRCRAALRPGGRLIVAEPVVHPAPDPQAAYFAAYFLAMGAGRLRPRRAIAALMSQAGLMVRPGGTSTFLCDVIICEQS